jgi:lipopolysaccharide biosynthesis glycosyltransferase
VIRDWRQVARAVRRRVSGRRPAAGSAAPERGVTSGAAPAAPPPQRSDDRRFRAAWTRLARATLDRRDLTTDTPFDPALVGEAADRAARNRGQAVLAAAISRGEDLVGAVRACVDELAEAKQWDAAWSLVEGVRRLEHAELPAKVGIVVLLHRRRAFDQVWTHVRNLDDETLARHMPVESVDAALSVRTEEASARARAVAARVELLSTRTLAELAGRFLAMHDRDTASDLVAAARQRDTSELDERRQLSLDLVTAWLSVDPPTVPRGSVPIGVIGYQSPDQVLASGNVGDFIQTLSLLGNLARFSDVEFTGEEDLGKLVTDLQDSVRERLRIPGVTGSAHLVPVSRDASSIEPVPDGTWLVAFGWHMHPMYDLRYDFPYHPNVRPLFVSFHVNRLDMLSEDALKYLRKHGPVGCRDWTTVFLLLSAGVDAFFTGCLTTTVNAVFPTRRQVRGGGPTGLVGVIDTPAQAAGRGDHEVRAYTHQQEPYRHMSLAAGVRAAMELLAGYQRDLDRVVTRRLHAYLPLIALGIPVKFKPWNAGDVRFPGLTGLSPDAPRLRRIQHGIRSLLAETLAAVISGADEEDVYRLWRRLTAERVQQAKLRFAETVVDEPPRLDVQQAVASARTAVARYGPHDGVEPGASTDVVMCFDQNVAGEAAVTIESMVSNASGPLRLWVMGRGLDNRYQRWLADAFADLPISFVSCDHIEYGEIGRLLTRISVSTMDRLLLPDLLTEVDRITYLDVDTVVLGDVCELGATDLDGHLLAARDSVVSGVSEWRNVGRRLPTKLSLELQRRMGQQHGYDYPALNAGVMVMDLARMRAEGFTRTTIPWVEKYGFNDQDVMLAAVGPKRRALDPRWNAFPFLETVEDPLLIHWAGGGKPWWRELVPWSETWRAHHARLSARAGSPPREAPNRIS